MKIKASIKPTAKSLGTMLTKLEADGVYSYREAMIERAFYFKCHTSKRK